MSITKSAEQKKKPSVFVKRPLPTLKRFKKKTASCGKPLKMGGSPLLLSRQKVVLKLRSILQRRPTKKPMRRAILIKLKLRKN